MNSAFKAGLLAAAGMAFAGMPIDLHGKYLDCHAHTAGIGAKGSGCFISPELRSSYKFPIYLKAFGVDEKELGLPLLAHTGTENSFLDAKDSLCDPFRLELPLNMGVTVIAAHAGTPGKSHGQENMERALIMMAEHPNLYADISSLTQINKLGYL